MKEGKKMKIKLNISDGKLNKIEKRLTKLVQDEYGPDGYVRIDRVTISFIEEKSSVDLDIAYGVMADGKCRFQEDLTLHADGSVDFIAGQLFHHIVDGNG